MSLSSDEFEEFVSLDLDDDETVPLGRHCQSRALT